MVIYRYSRWDGSQNVEFPTTEDLIDRLSEQILQGDDLRGALRRMMQRGFQDSKGQRGMGMQDLLDKLREARERNLERYNLASMFDDIAKQVDEVIEQERRGIDQAPSKSYARPRRRGRARSPVLPGREEKDRSRGEGGDDIPQELADMLRQMANRHLDQLDQLPPNAGGRIKKLRDYDFMDPEAPRKVRGAAAAAPATGAAAVLPGVFSRACRT